MHIAYMQTDEYFIPFSGETGSLKYSMDVNFKDSSQNVLQEVEDDGML